MVGSPISAKGKLRIRNTFLEFGDEQNSCSFRKRRSQSVPDLTEKPRSKSKDQVVRSSSYTEFDRTDSTKMTTMMVRNLPQRCKQERFINLLDSYGFEGTYDFVYVPYCTKRRKNKGYGFVNFLDVENGKLLHRLWNRQQVFPAVSPTQPTKALSVGFAATQGVEENVRALQDNDSLTFYRAVQPARITGSSAGAVISTRAPNTARPSSLTDQSRRSLHSEFALPQED